MAGATQTSEVLLEEPGPWCSMKQVCDLNVLRQIHDDNAASGGQTDASIASAVGLDASRDTPSLAVPFNKRDYRWGVRRWRKKPH